MKQILQNLKNGEITVAEVPSPQVKEGHLRIKTILSLISPGTEKMLLGFGRSNYLNKAKQQPDKVKQVLTKIKTDGLKSTIDTVSTRLDEPLPLGYSNVGKITHIGDGVDGFKIGDRVVSNGRHAEIVNIPKNLCVKIPNQVSDETAVFTVVSSIALQGVRLANPTIGETFVVYGLGLIGLLTIQILKANGCRVLGLDINTERVEIAKMFAIEAINLSQGVDSISAGLSFSNGNGVDSVIITASAKDDSIIRNAAKMSRKRGRIVLIGVVGLKLNRSDFYDKELSFQVSCSYGPGRYDSDYEEQGNDYPLGYVRWTEKRNFEAILELMASGLIETKPLITSRVLLEKSPEAYDKIVAGKGITTILQYSEKIAYDKRTIDTNNQFHKKSTNHIKQLRVGIIGSGNFTKARILPILNKTNVFLDTIVSANGLSSYSAAKKYGIQKNTNDVNTIISNKNIDTVFIMTRHDSHANLVLESLTAGKNVYVEKPLALNINELDNIKLVMDKDPISMLMVGYNRRFAPHIIKMKGLLDVKQQPKSFIFTINSGSIPADHWAQDSKVGGGRINGEVCHFIDLMCFLSGSPINEWSVQSMNNDMLKDKVTINLIFDDGSFGSIHYFANGSKRFPKERIEVFCDGSIIQLDNFRKMKGYDWSGFKKMNLFRQDKGHQAEIIAFVDAIKNGKPSPISFNELYEVTKVTIKIANSI